jgi:predicted ATPase
MNSTNESVNFSSLSDSNTFLFDDENCNNDSLPHESTELFGRNSEIETLRQAFEHIQYRENKHTQFVRVLVHGESGYGKTSLVDTLRQPVLECHGFFVYGKYFQSSGNQEPYSAIMAAFSDLCDLVCQSENYNEDQRKIVQNHLNPEHSWLLEKTISNIAPFLDKTKKGTANDRSVDVRDAAIFSTFKEACKSFLQAISSLKRPIILFIDDIQWMDEGSKQLLSFIWQDQKLDGTMLILAFRDEDAEMETCIRNEFIRNNHVIDIPLKSLDIDDIYTLVISLIPSRHKSNNSALSNVFKSKTRGNPFHIMQLIEISKKEGLLSFDAQTNSWDFDVDSIQSHFMISHTLADLLAIKVNKLPQEVQDNLKIASLLGFRFREDMVSEVKSLLDDVSVCNGCPLKYHGTSTESESSVTTNLKVALDGGFVERCKYGYNFSHDKLQAIFQSMLTEDLASKIHGIIGNVYVAMGDSESIYHAVNHLQLCRDYALYIDDKVKFAQMHLTAAHFCKDRSSFIQASDLLKRGLDLIEGKDKWEAHFDLAFALTETLAKVELIIGNLDSCSLLTKIALDRAKTKELKINALVTNVECCMAGNDVISSVLAATQALRDLGIWIPRKISFWHVAKKFTKVKWLIGRKSDEDILNLPQISDRLLSTIVRLLVNLCMYCFLRDDEMQGAYAALLAAEFTIKKGLSPYSPSAIAIYGVAELSNGCYSRAYRFGRLALKMLKSIGSNVAEPYTTGMAFSLLTHWFDPLQDMPSILRQVAQHGFNIGDVVNGSFCLGMSYSIEIYLGTNLEYLETSCERMTPEFVNNPRASY